MVTAHPPLLRTAEEIARARDRLERLPAARVVAERTLALADRWVAFSDASLRAIVPPPEVPRAFNTSFEGCPIHGRALFAYGNYSWRFDPFAAPWKLTCPVGGETYPSNDFAAFLASGLHDRRLLTGPYADDGRGWQPPTGDHKHWFVAYYCHWLWQDHLIPATLALARAYLLTANEAYAHKAGVLLTRIAEDYPRMDINRQSRYAAEFVPSYTGKIVNAIWETGTARDLAEAWDAVNQVVLADAALGADAVALVERDLLREALAAIPQRRILGNYGMHQQTAAYLALALGDPDQAATTIRNLLLGWPGMDGFQYEGIPAVLANLFGAEGISYETAPGYASIPSNMLPALLEPLRRLQDLTAGPALPHVLAEQMTRLAALVTWPARLVCLGQWTPAIGDSGTAAAPSVTDVSREALRAVYEQTGDAAVAARLRAMAKDGAAFQQYGDLFAGELPDLAATTEPAPLESDVLTDYGLAILRSGAGRCATALTVHYGRANAGHAHADRLNLEFFGAGRKLIPDIGYPQFAADDKRANAWDRNTGNHTLVVVDGQAQPSRNGGDLLLFARSPWLQVVAANAPAYLHATHYQRTTLLVGDGASGPAYAVDLFHVRGGRRHDYRLHGPDLPLQAEDVAFGPELPGTLAGPDIPLELLWDDPALERPDRTRSFGTYAGCGDSFLYGIQMAQTPSDTWRLRWGADDGLRVHLPPSDAAQAFLAWGDVPRRPGNPERLHYLILRHDGASDTLESTFAAVLEPVVGVPAIQAVERLDSGGPGAVALRVTHGEGNDTILIADPEHVLQAAGFRLVGRLAVVRADRAGAPYAAYLSGRSLQGPGIAFTSTAPLRGTIGGVDAEGREVVIDLQEPPAAPDVVARGLTGTVFAVEGNHQCALILSADPVGAQALRLRLDRTALVGRLTIEVVHGATITTRTTLYPPFGGRDDIGRHLEGTWLAANRATCRLEAISIRPPQGHTLKLDASVDDAFVPNAVVTLLAWHVGAAVTLTPAVWWAR